MELVLAISALFLSCVFTVILNKKIEGFFLALVATQQVYQGTFFLICLCVAVFMQSLYIFIPQKKNRLFWITTTLLTGYIAIIFMFKPYKINITYFLVYAESLLLFIWAMFIKWDAKKIIAIVSALGAYLLAFGFAEWLIIGSQRIEGPLTVATAYAIVLVLTWAIWFVENCFSHRFSYLYMALGTFAVFIAVMLSGTRMGIIGIAMGLLLGIAMSSWALKFKNNTLFQKIFYSMLIIGCTLFVIFTVWTFIPNDVFIKRGLNTVLAGKIDSSNMGRITVWITALNAIPEHKMWGIGPGNFLNAHKLFLQSLPSVIDVPKAALIHAHNIYLVILCEHGLSGFLILGTVVLACFMQLFSRLKNSNSPGIYYALLSGGIIMMVLGMVDAVPLYLPTMGWGAWYMGVLASFSLTEEPGGKPI